MSTGNPHSDAMDNLRTFIKSELIVSTSDITDEQELLMSGPVSYTHLTLPTICSV